MSLIMLEGFDYADTTSLVDKGWNNAINNFSLSTGRFGVGSRVALGHYLSWVYKILPSTYSTLYFGCALTRSAGTPAYAGNRQFLGFRDETGVFQVRLYGNATNGFDIYKGDETLIGSTDSNLFFTGVWGYLEVKIVIHATAGEVTLRWNEKEVFSDTACDTKNGSDYIGQIYHKCLYNAIGIYFDDMYLDDSQFHGNCQVLTLLPDSDGTHTDFVRSTGSNDYECVDDSVPNEETDYIKAATVGNKSTFGITTGELKTVKGIQVDNLLSLTSAGVRNIKTIVRSNSTDYQSAESVALSASWQYEIRLWDTDPDDSNPWTQTKLEAAEFGLEITV